MYKAVFSSTLDEWVFLELTGLPLNDKKQVSAAFLRKNSPSLLDFSNGCCTKKMVLKKGGQEINVVYMTSQAFITAHQSVTSKANDEVDTSLGSS